ncbi:hypothetical protein HG536_0E00690 [Torulaspora globosa]|uniref:non-specific serine/threonine protein kinase n=1 Tax=Torulaspora globosa TaxID=48254 RepID=A0A7G3ZI23_9SACH|nr:uncharacterized protein HG536_0E00690 [Torulaspora globosa]QLL33159.1 hypothetical protein HG536_0E00690 [Torulaspora globosa]
MKKSIGGDSGNEIPAKMDQDIGSLFKRSEIIGRGKFGVVYKGYHVRTKQVYAIKVLNLDSDEDEVEDVQREIQFLASMKQVPNITHYYGSYLKDTSLWIIIEYCAGGSLRTLLRPGKIDEKYIGVIMRELLMALKYIHKDNVIHRDIKAANVLITNDGQVKLCDFGVAAQLNQTRSRRQTMAGTPYWMAPEVIMEGVYYDTKVDIWSLGITAYEIATGNPPYCEVEALRAMQLITKSKPPRLEGRNYSALLKEFIALCLDEDPKARLSAEELLKTKFIKTHKATSSALLKQLISRYLLFRDNKKKTRESVFLADEDPRADHKKYLQNDQLNGKTSEDSSDFEVDVKWDFDSLSSADYIIENDINLEEIPEGSAYDWASAQDQHNYAYPDEDQFYCYPTNNNNGKVYQGTTMGKTQPGTMLYNSTLNAPLSHNNTTGNFPTRMMKSVRTNPTVGTGSHTNSGGAKRSEMKVPKKLSELFEKVEQTNENIPGEPELSRINRNVSHLHMGSLPEDTAALPVSELPAVRPHVGAINNGNFHSQSTPVLPVIQTKFSKATKGPPTAVTTAPTPIEIEIPEELPTTTAAGSSNSDALAASHTKPRSSTVSTPGPTSHPKAPGISRRLTVGTAVAPVSSNRGIDEKPKKMSNSPNDNAESNTLSSNVANIASSGPSNKLPLKSPSPTRSYTNLGSSPTKRPGNSPTTGTAQPPTMKALGNAGENKDPLLQPINTNLHISNEIHNSMADKETSRVNRDFKRNNPNLKLQMPLPTSVVPHKLLDPSSSAVAATGSNNGPAGENINQFGFNTSSASNIPVSMTPINEKHIDWGKKPKRGPSISNRKNSQNADISISTSTSGPTMSVNGAQSTVPLNTGPMSSSSLSVASMFPNGSSASVTASGQQSSQINALGATNSTSNAISNTNASTVSGNLHSPTVLQPPPSTINMGIFLDVDANMPDSNSWVDKKPLVLHELEALLKMYEEGLPVIENALKKQLISAEVAQGDH